MTPNLDIDEQRDLQQSDEDKYLDDEYWYDKWLDQQAKDYWDSMREEDAVFEWCERRQKNERK